MAGSKFLLDTVIVAAYFNREQAIREKLAGVTVYVSSITIGELYFGAYNSQQSISNVQQIRDFMTISTVLHCDATTGDHYGQIKRMLRTKGRPIPENDIWIAATAFQHGLTLVSRDAHFNEVSSLTLVVW
ncbi:MAG: type II toxin-antitoxin system VapC family toxin [Anaerolineae bacterium]|nr:type II toxin-antitoxin system VapC family toxin [Anaerolineae bacterium]